MASITASKPTAQPAQLDDILTRESRSFWQDAWWRFRHDRLALLGGIIFLLLCLIALSAPLISQYVTGYDPDRINLRENYQAPGPTHWFGTDEYGRDYFTRTVYAGRISLSIGFLFAAVSLTIGSVLGLAGGYYGKFIDDALQAP